jgi:uroporphyrinogen decarboxylase
MLLTEADAFELDYKMDIHKAYELLNNTATFVGNIDPSGIICMGTAEAVREKTLELLNIYRNSNRFILNACCAIPAETPPENLQTMLETARKF